MTIEAYNSVSHAAYAKNANTPASTAKSQRDTAIGIVDGSTVRPSSTYRWSRSDTVELSAGIRNAREVLDSAPEFSRAASEKSRTEELEYTAADLASIKEKFSSLMNQRKDVASRLKKLGQSFGLSSVDIANLKVEIGKDGKALVGGNMDAKTQKRFEEAINNDEELLGEIRSCQKLEKEVDADFLNTTGKSLREYVKQVDGVRTAKLFLDRADETLYSRSEQMTLRGDDLYLADSELAGMVSEYCQSSIYDMDISGSLGGFGVLEDAETTANVFMQDVTSKIDAVFDKYNEGLRHSLAEGWITQEEYDDSVVNLYRLNITVNNEGAVAIEGTASKNSKASEEFAKETINSMFEEALAPDAETGRESDFMYATQYLMNKYENVLGEAPEDLTLEVMFNHGKIESHFDSPKKEAELREQIAADAKEFFTDLGYEEAEGLEIVVDDAGKVVIDNMPADEEEAGRLGAMLEMLNGRTSIRTLDDTTNGKFTDDTVGRLKGALAHLDLFLPGGAGILSDYAAA